MSRRCGRSGRGGGGAGGQAGDQLLHVVVASETQGGLVLRRTGLQLQQARLPVGGRAAGLMTEKPAGKGQHDRHNASSSRSRIHTKVHASVNDCESNVVRVTAHV